MAVKYEGTVIEQTPASTVVAVSIHVKDLS